MEGEEEKLVGECEYRDSLMVELEHDIVLWKRRAGKLE